MKINFEVPDEWASKLDELARQDGHSNRSAVIRKIVNLFFACNLQFSSVFDKEQNHSKTVNQVNTPASTDEQ